MFTNVFLLILCLVYRSSSEHIEILYDEIPSYYPTYKLWVDFHVYTDDNNTITEEVTCKLSSTDSCVTFQESTLTITKGISRTILTFAKTGECQIKAEVSSLNIEKYETFEVDPLKFVFSKSNSANSATSNDQLSYTIEVYDSKDNFVQDFSESLSLTIGCVNSNCSGKKLRLVENESVSEGDAVTIRFYYGRFTTDSLYILSSGSFHVQVISDYGEGYSKVIQIQNYLQDIQITLDKNMPDAYMEFDVLIELFGDDSEYYIQPTHLDFITDFDYYNGEKSADIVNGYWSFSCYYNHSGNYDIEVTNNVSNSITEKFSSVKVNALVLKFSDFSKELPTNDRHTFGYTVSIYDSYEKTIRSDLNNVEVKSFVDDDHSLGGDSIITSENGIAVFKKINFDDPGKQKLSATIGDEAYAYNTSFDIASTECSVGSGPIASTSVLIFLGIFLPFVFYNTDKQVQTYPTIRIFFLIHPLTALFIKSPSMRRVSVSILLITSELIMITLIGAVFSHFDDTTEHYDKDFTDYYGRILYKGAMGWAISQAAIIPLFFLNVYSINNRKFLKIFFITCIILIILCFGAMIGMTIKYCIGFSQYWTANFLIFLLFDLVLMHVIYTIIAAIFLPKKIKSTLTPKPDYTTANIDKDNELAEKSKV